MNLEALHKASSDTLLRHLPHDVDELSNFLLSIRLDDCTLLSAEDLWVQRWEAFCQEESMISGQSQIDLCKPTGSIQSKILVQLNHPTYTCTEKPGTTLDAMCISTRVLLLKGVTPENAFTFDSFNRRCKVRKVKTDGALRRTFRTEPSFWSDTQQTVHFKLMMWIWRTSPAGVVIGAGQENKNYLKQTLDLDLIPVELEDGVGVEVSLWRDNGTLRKIIVFVWHPEFAWRARTIHFSQAFDSMINFGYSLAGVPISQHGWQQVAGVSFPDHSIVKGSMPTRNPLGNHGVRERIQQHRANVDRSEGELIGERTMSDLYSGKSIKPQVTSSHGRKKLASINSYLPEIVTDTDVAQARRETFALSVAEDAFGTSILEWRQFPPSILQFLELHQDTYQTFISTKDHTTQTAVKTLENILDPDRRFRRAFVQQAQKHRARTDELRKAVLEELTRGPTDSDPKQVTLACEISECSDEYVDADTRYHVPSGKYIVKEKFCDKAARYTSANPQTELSHGSIDRRNVVENICKAQKKMSNNGQLSGDPQQDKRALLEHLSRARKGRNTKRDIETDDLFEVNHLLRNAVSEEPRSVLVKCKSCGTSSEADTSPRFVRDDVGRIVGNKDSRVASGRYAAQTKVCPSGDCTTNSGKPGRRVMVPESDLDYVEMRVVYAALRSMNDANISCSTWLAERNDGRL